MSREELEKRILEARYNLVSSKDKETIDILEELAIKALEQEPKWIPVSERAAEFPCLASDNIGQMWIPVGIVTIDGHCYDGKNFKFDVDEFLKGEEVIIDGQKGYILPTEIVAWMPLPELYEPQESEG